jgi:hypothetical protein
MPGVYDRRMFRMADGGMMPSVYDRPMFRMADGGMMPPGGEMMPPGGEMMPPGGEMMPPGGEMDPEMQRINQEIDSMPPEMQKAEASKMFQEALRSGIEESAGQEANRSIQNVGNATGFLDLMNAVWDDEADVEVYRSRLAEVVGPEDAARTPDSVLVLVQPTLQLAQLDQGIGSLMQQELAEMGAEGAMGGGIAELATKSAVADAMAAETGALVNRVGSLSQGPWGPMGMDPEMQGAMDPGMQGAMGMDPEMLQAMMMQGAGPTGQGMV